MSLTEIFGQTATVWIIVPLLIILARVLDVSIGTIRLIFVARGMKILAPMLGFVEVLIWLIAVSQILQNLTNWQNYVAYATGFALGNYVGMLLEDRLALGTVILRVITQRDATDLEQALRTENFGVTAVDAEGKDGPVKLLFMLLSRQTLEEAIKLVEKYNPNAFYSVEDVRFVHQGVYPQKRRKNLALGQLFGGMGKRK